MPEWTVEFLVEHFTEDELYDWAMEKERLRETSMNAVISYENSIKELKKSIRENEEFTDKLWKAMYLLVCEADKEES